MDNRQLKMGESVRICLYCDQRSQIQSAKADLVQLMNVPSVGLDDGNGGLESIASSRLPSGGEVIAKCKKVSFKKKFPKIWRSHVSGVFPLHATNGILIQQLDMFWSQSIKLW